MPYPSDTARRIGAFVAIPERLGDCAIAFNKRLDREQKWNEAILANYNDAKLEALEKHWHEKFADAVRNGGDTVAMHRNERIIRRVRINRMAEVNSAAHRLGVKSPIAGRTLNGGTEKYIDALQTVLESVTATRPKTTTTFGGNASVSTPPAMTHSTRVTRRSRSPRDSGRSAGGLGRRPFAERTSEP